MKALLSITFLFFYLFLPAQKSSLPVEVKQSIEKRIEYGNNPSVVVAMISPDGTAYFNFGKTEANGSKVDEHTIYEIGSITKVFTAILLADEVIKGQMSLDDPAQNYMPTDVKLPTYNGQAFTLGQLSDHTSGLPRLPSNMNPADPSNPYADYTVQQMYDFLSGYTLPRAPGEEYEYSNLAVGLLGHILELRESRPYEELLVEEITKPLGMMETKITLDQNMKNHLASGHANETIVTNWDLPTLAGAGAIRSSSYDLIKFVAANLGITKSNLDHAMQVTRDIRHEKAGSSKLGLGWHIRQSGTGNIYWHNGGTGGYRTFLGFNLITKQGVVVLTNSDQGVDDIGIHLLDKDFPLNQIQPRMAKALKEFIDKEGVADFEKKFNKLKKENKYEVIEDDINSLGYWYLNDRKNLEAAAALFKINVMEFPKSSNVYDSYGEALMNQGKKEEAISNYKKSLELNPGNLNAVEMLAKMGVEYEMKKLQVDEKTLAQYDGVYQLAPSFNITITHEGEHLYAQATNQGKYEIFASSETEFFYDVVDARIVFSLDKEGKWMLTLFQNGQKMPGKRL